MIHSKNFEFESVPKVFTRGSQVLLAIFYEDKLALAGKKFYPEGIYRMFGGGCEPREEKIIAAIREMQEETGLRLGPRSFDRKESFKFTFSEKLTNVCYSFESELFYVKPETNVFKPLDDVNEVKWVSKEEYQVLLDKYKTLPMNPAPVTNGPGFSWHDWGEVFLIPHEYVFNHWNL